MKSRFPGASLKRNFHHWIQRVDILCGVITRDVKNQTVDSGAEIFALRQQLTTSPVLIGARRVQQAPISRGVILLQPHRYVRGGLSANQVQNVG